MDPIVSRTLRLMSSTITFLLVISDSYSLEQLILYCSGWLKVPLRWCVPAIALTLFWTMVGRGSFASFRHID